MKTLLLNSDYTFDPSNSVWCRHGYSGIAYSDGDTVEQRIATIISEATDLSVLSTELRKQCTDWPSLYHLTGTRANILRPFKDILPNANVLEIGAGCGAITRFLGESGANVLALEGSPRRAAIARSRTRDLHNVTVLCEKFEQISLNCQFDVITLIGVLEYANLFTSDENPHLAMLKQVRSLLKPDGKLIIAIENQLGLKYFAGAPEDHIGQPMYGIEGRYRKDQPQTFGRKILVQLLNESGFISSQFMAPFPDYKLPVSIITEEGLANKSFDAAAFAWQSARRDPQLPAYSSISLELAWPVIFQNEMAIDVANSFLIVVTPQANAVRLTDALAYHYSTDRIPSYCKETVFIQENGEEIRVQYRRLGAPNANADGSSSEVIKFICPESDRYTLGRPLSLELVNIVTKDGWTFSEVARFIERYLLMIKQNFGLKNDIDISVSTTKLPGEAFDVVPQNIIVDRDGHFNVIDKEWQLTIPIEVGHLIFRSLLLLVNQVSHFGRPATQATVLRLTFFDGVFESLGLHVTEDDYSRYIKLESEIQQCISGRPAEDFVDWAPVQPLPKIDTRRAVAERDGQIASLNQTVAERDEQIAKLNQTVAERDEQIAKLNHTLAERDGQIYAFLSSRSWRLTAPLRLIHQKFK